MQDGDKDKIGSGIVIPNDSEESPSHTIVGAMPLCQPVIPVPVR